MLLHFSPMKDQTVWHISLTSYCHLSSSSVHRPQDVSTQHCTLIHASNCQYGACSFTLYQLMAGALTEALAWVCSFLSLSHSPGSHVEWCKQLIAATISSQISGGVPPEAITRECKVREWFSLLIRPVLYKISMWYMYSQLVVTTK